MSQESYDKAAKQFRIASKVWIFCFVFWLIALVMDVIVHLKYAK